MANITKAVSCFHDSVAYNADEIIHNGNSVKPWTPWNPPFPIDSPGAQPCVNCTLMTGTCGGLRNLLSHEGYAHHEFSALEESANAGCPLCGLLCTTLSRGQLYEQGSEGKFTGPLHNYQGIKTVLTATYDKIDLGGDATQPSTIRLKNLTVIWLYNGRKCRYNIPGQAGRTVELQIFTDENEPEVRQSIELGGQPTIILFQQRPLSISVSSDQIISKYRTRLRDCLTNHYPTCLQFTPQLPPRVVNVESKGTLNGLSLYMSAPGECSQYVALSYCWGDPPHPFVTTKATLENPSKMDWGQLPATIMDAVKVVRGLGIRYLWVDALCIAQDDEADKTDQITRMGKIYRDATITIAAASSSNVYSGFLRDRQIPKFPMPFDDGSRVIWCLGTLCDLPDEPLDKRGWTLQEALLSPRILYYGSKDLVWKCEKIQFEPVIATYDMYRPDEPFRLPKGFFSPDFTDERKILSHISWQWVQRTYSRRHLKLSEDRFRALGGIAKEFQRASGDTYIAGLWASTFVHSLAWFRDSNEVKDAPPPPPCSSPSWSWVPLGRPVSTFACDDEPDHPMSAQLKSWSIDLADEHAPFGHILGGAAELLANIIQTTKLPADVAPPDNLMVDWDVPDRATQHASKFVGNEYYYLRLGRGPKHLLALLLWSKGPGSFVRRGLLVLELSQDALWKSEHAQRKVIRLE